jgi:NAD(P)H dehydrogenase (quinone)
VKVIDLYAINFNPGRLLVHFLFPPFLSLLLFLLLFAFPSPLSSSWSFPIIPTLLLISGCLPLPLLLVSGRHNFTSVVNPDFLKQQPEEVYASEHDTFSPDIKEAIDSIDWCDVLIFQFPLWWFGLPAILKGWVDRWDPFVVLPLHPHLLLFFFSSSSPSSSSSSFFNKSDQLNPSTPPTLRVFVMGRVYGYGKWYTNGGWKGKKAFLSLTTGAPQKMFSGPDALQVRRT